jgi:hypothetical protein
VRSSILIAVISIGMIVVFSSESFGQLTVQQPVIQSTGGNFAVSVPDRGGILLGSISRAGESRKSYGLPFTRGSSVGRFAQHSSLSSHVWIHDLREMDQMILDMAETDPRGQKAATSAAARRAGLAWSDFQPRRGAFVEDRRPSSLPVSQRSRSRYVVGTLNGRSRTSSTVSDRKPTTATAPPVAATPRQSRALDPAHSYRLGVEAEESGKLSLAKLHYLAAAQYGSAEGARRLRELAAQPVAAK